jgi:hypothetical protein
MTELDLIRAFRANPTPPSHEARQRAQRAWSQPPRRPRRPILSGAVAAGLCAAVAAVAFVSLDGGGEQVGSPPAHAAEILRRAATAAVQLDGLGQPLQPGEYWYVKTLDRQQTPYSEPPAFTASETTIREEWTASDGSGRFSVRSAGEPRFPTPSDRSNWIEHGRPELGWGAGSSYPKETNAIAVGDESFTVEQLLALPSDPERLHARLRRAAGDLGSSPEQETFTIVADILGNPIPASLRASLLRAAARIPGIETVENVRDIEGRPGVAVALDDRGRTLMLIFDGETYALLGKQHLSPSGMLEWGSATLADGIVDSDRSRPRER